jgi:hypothetical protein
VKQCYSWNFKLGSIITPSRHTTHAIAFTARARRPCNRR